MGTESHVGRTRSLTEQGLVPGRHGTNKEDLRVSDGTRKGMVSGTSGLTKNVQRPVRDGGPTSENLSTQLTRTSRNTGVLVRDTKLTSVL